MKHVDTISSVTKTARRQVSKTTSLNTEDVKNPEKLTELLKSAYRRISDLEARLGPEPVEFEVYVTTGSSVRLAHGFGCPVRWTATHVDKKLGGISPIRTEPRPLSFAARPLSIVAGTTAPAGNFTTGTQWRMRQRKEVLGIRFFWRAGAAPASRTVRAKLWNNSTGAVLATKDVSIISGSELGFFEAMFSTPLTTDLTGVDITTSVWNTSGAIFVTSTDAVWGGYNLPFYFNEDLTLISAGVDAAGDARPTTNQTTVSYPVEPILGNNSSGPDLVRDSTSDDDNLVLKTYVTGKLVIRVEPSQTGLVV